MSCQIVRSTVVLAVVLGCSVSVSAHEHHIHAPFVHVDKDSQGDVRVDAPFTHVRNPKGPGNVKVAAPFTHVQDRPGSGTSTVKAPAYHKN